MESERLRAYRLSQMRRQSAQTHPQQHPQTQPAVDCTALNEARLQREYAAIQEQFRQIFGDVAIADADPAPIAPPMPQVNQSIAPVPQGFAPSYADQNERIAALTRLRQSIAPGAAMDESHPGIQRMRQSQSEHLQRQRERALAARKYAELIGRTPTPGELDRWLASQK